MTLVKVFIDSGVQTHLSEGTISAKSTNAVTGVFIRGGPSKCRVLLDDFQEQL